MQLDPTQPLAARLKIAGDIMTGILERLAFRNDYMRTGIVRAKEQWIAKHEQIGILLKSASENFGEAEDRKNISELIEDHESIGKAGPFLALLRLIHGLFLRSGISS
jgi:hypothetical protein